MARLRRLPKPLGEASSVLVFRVLRELLTNVVKHAQATQVDISVNRNGDHLSLHVDDNGVGFDADETVSQLRGGPRATGSSASRSA